MLEIRVDSPHAVAKMNPIARYAHTLATWPHAAKHDEADTRIKPMYS